MTASLPGPVDSTEAIRLALRSWPEVETYLDQCKGVIVPLGSTEQHGPTGAIGTDALTAEAVRRISSREACGQPMTTRSTVPCGASSSFRFARAASSKTSVPCQPPSGGVHSASLRVSGGSSETPLTHNIGVL